MIFPLTLDKHWSSFGFVLSIVPCMTSFYHQTVCRLAPLHSRCPILVVSFICLLVTQTYFKLVKWAPCVESQLPSYILLPPHCPPSTLHHHDHSSLRQTTSVTHHGWRSNVSTWLPMRSLTRQLNCPIPSAGAPSTGVILLSCTCSVWRGGLYSSSMLCRPDNNLPAR